MKKVLTILMLTLSLATFAQNATKVVILDTYNKGGKVKQTTLAELKSNLAQAISDTYGFEGVVNDDVDRRLYAEGFEDHPHLSKEQAEWVFNLSEVQYVLMSSASIEQYGDLSLQVMLIDLAVYQVMATESIIMNDKLENARAGCEALVKKIIVYLPVPQEPIVENETESEKPSTTTEQSKKQEETEVHKTYSMPSGPQQLTSLEADKVSRHLNRADVCIEMNYIDNAIKEYNEIVKIAPGWANVYMYLGNIYTLKGDDASLKLAVECYDIFMQLTDDQNLYYEAQDKLSRVEMMTELKAKEESKEENLVGTWRTNRYDKITGKPLFILNITKTPEPNKFQITVSPQSLMYNNIVNTKAYAEIIDGKIGFSYTFQETYIPKQSTYNEAGAIVNYLFGGSLAGALGGAFIETLREEDMGYTNIMDFDFIADVNIKNDNYNTMSDGYLEGVCHMKGEHHQAGRSNVELDTIYECDLLKGGDLFPVVIKVLKRGNKYYYGDIQLTDNKSINDNPLCNYSPYVSKKEYEKGYITMNRRVNRYGFVVIPEIAAALGGVLLFDPQMSTQVKYSKEIGLPLLIVGSMTTILVTYRMFSAVIKWNKYVKQCYEDHNRHVDENMKKIDEDMKKYRRKDQANVSVNVGISPLGAGIYIDF